MSSCHQRKSHSIIKVEEQGERSTFKLHNPRRLEVDHFKLDECQARGNQLGCKEQTKTCAFQNNLQKKVSHWQGQKRCDALLEIAEKETQIFVELKGQDIAAGMKQLEASLNLFAKANWQKQLFLSCNSKGLKKLNTKIKLFKARLRKNYKKTDFAIKSEHHI